jgi:hypothetical protein
LIDVFFLSLVWRYNLAITNSQVQYLPVVYILYRRPLGGNIYKKWELGVRLAVENWEVG